MNTPPEMIAPETDVSAATRDNLSPLLADIRARRNEFARAQKLPDDIIDAFKRAGVYRAMAAKRFGGEERTPADFCRLIERISEADGSAGWVASFGEGACYLSALPGDTLCEVYANGPDVVYAGAVFPLQTAKRSADGFVVNGVWPFASGSPRSGADRRWDHCGG
ncbi:alkylation response protein AidB-like acyl-CoA dehydrogenase [Bradyrhizobium sp. USDA 4341]